MVRASENTIDLSTELARLIPESLHRERVIPRFVDAYVVEHGRYGLQVHATRYKDLLALLQREALLAASVRALEAVTSEPQLVGKLRASALSRKEAAVFRRKYLSSLSRHLQWNAGDALDFQSDLQMYEEIVARNAQSRRGRRPLEAANHPFVDRCAFLLDSSFMEKARLAATRALVAVEELAAATVRQVSTRKPA